eukprot:8868123-Alexandrium_andersonii.AAC.1
MSKRLDQNRFETRAPAVFNQSPPFQEGRTGFAGGMGGMPFQAHRACGLFGEATDGNLMKIRRSFV